MNRKEKELFDEIYNNNKEKVISILNEANQMNAIFNINKKDTNGGYPLLWVVEKDNIEMVKLIIDYANNNNIILDINGKNIEKGKYPLYFAVCNHNVEMIKLLIDYANKKYCFKN